ncbi:MAG: hypothetical protein OXI86_05220 [Candidatus Poribacteria bacterium]|nr:hypothetical protein [Candidatus Poribacteria bacterium]
MPFDDPIDRARRGRQALELRGQELAYLIAIDAVPPVLQNLLLNILGASPTFPLRPAALGEQGLLRPTLAEPVIILQEGLPMSLMEAVEIRDKPELGVPFPFNQLVFLDQEFPLPDIVTIEGLIFRIFAHRFVSR